MTHVGRFLITLVMWLGAWTAILIGWLTTNYGLWVLGLFIGQGAIVVANWWLNEVSICRVQVETHQALRVAMREVAREALEEILPAFRQAVDDTLDAQRHDFDRIAEVMGEAMAETIAGSNGSNLHPVRGD